MNALNIRFFRFPLNLLLVLVVMASFALDAGAAQVQFTFPMSGDQQVPPSGSAGTGDCTVLLDDVTGDVSVDCTFSDLGSAATAAHIHGLAPAGVNAGVIVPLTASAATSGTISGGGTLAGPDIQGMLDGLTYVNLHSTDISGGEIRGQVLNGRVLGTGGNPARVPVNSVWSLALLTLVLLIVGGAWIRGTRS